MNIEVKIEKYDNLGRGIGYYNNKIVFIPKALIGEIVKIQIVKESKQFYVGKIIDFVLKSDKRENPICPFYDKCGGCDFRHISYEEELNIKQKNLKDILKKYANIDILPELIKGKSESGYRNKITLKIENYEWGYYNNESHEFVKIDKCLLAKSAINRIISNKDLINVKNGQIVIRSNYNDEVIIKIDTLDEYKIDVNTLKKNNKIVGIIVNDNIISGENYFIEKVDGLLFRVNINSFFQVNLEVLNEVFKLLKINSYSVVVDLYCGVGTLGIPLKKEKLYGIEIVKDAVIDAIKNAKMNRQNNFYMFGDASKLSKIKDNIDLIIIDPPRSGLNKNTLNEVLKVSPQNIIYMSCNPITLARDLNILKDYYDIKINLLEMFPRTKHIETLCFMNRKK